MAWKANLAGNPLCSNLIPALLRRRKRREESGRGVERPSGTLNFDFARVRSAESASRTFRASSAREFNLARNNYDSRYDHTLRANRTNVNQHIQRECTALCVRIYHVDDDSNGAAEVVWLLFRDAVKSRD